MSMSRTAFPHDNSFLLKFSVTLSAVAVEEKGELQFRVLTSQLVDRLFIPSFPCLLLCFYKGQDLAHNSLAHIPKTRLK